MRSTTPVIETQRLKLLEFTHEDLDDLSAMFADHDQMRFYPRTRTRDEALAWLDQNTALYSNRGFGVWAVASLATSRFLGYCGIRPLSIHGTSETEIGWHIRKIDWGRGIATEAALGARDLAFGRFRLSRLVATIDPDHFASRRVAEKIGMREEGATVLDDWAAVVYSTEKQL